MGDEQDEVVVHCGMCGTPYPFGYEHRCGGGEVVVKPPEDEGLSQLAEYIARDRCLGMMEFESREQKRGLVRAVLHLAHR